MQSSTALSKIRQQLKALDWSMVKGSAIMTVGSFGARALAMLFWLILAQNLTPENYGSVQYAITVGTLLALLTQPFGQHVMARYIAKYRQDNDTLSVYLGNSWIILGILTLLTMMFGIPLLLFTGHFDLGVFAVFLGTTVFYTYWGIATGYEAAGRLTAAYFFCNLIQLIVAFLVIRLFNITSYVAMAVVFGLSYGAPLIVIQLIQPFPFMLDKLRPDRAALKDLWQFFWPILISHIFYQIYIALPVLLLERFAGKEAIGVYSLANTLTATFGILNLSVSTLFFPKAAALDAKQRGRMLLNIIGIQSVVNAVLLVAYALTVGWFVETFFGPEYLSSLDTYIVLAIGTILLGMQGFISTAMVGGGQVRLDAVFRLVSLVVTAIVAWVLIPQMAELGAAYGILAGTVAVLVVYPLLALFNRRKSANANLEG